MKLEHQTLRYIQLFVLFGSVCVSMYHKLEIRKRSIDSFRSMQCAPALRRLFHVSLRHIQQWLEWQRQKPRQNSKHDLQSPVPSVYFIWRRILTRYFQMSWLTSDIVRWGWASCVHVSSSSVIYTRRTSPFLILILLNFVLEWLTLLIRIREVSSSNLVPETG
jgi:hypothetical protein